MKGPQLLAMQVGVERWKEERWGEHVEGFCSLGEAGFPPTSCESSGRGGVGLMA